MKVNRYLYTAFGNLVLGFLGLLPCPSRAQTSDPQPPPGMAADYPLDGNAHDLSGNGYNEAALSTALGTNRSAGIPGYTYLLQRAENITGPWTTLESITVGSDGIGTFQDAHPPVGNAFYRTLYP